MKARIPTANHPTDLRSAAIKNPEALITLRLKDHLDIVEQYLAQECDKISTQAFNTCKVDVASQILSIVLVALLRKGYTKVKLKHFISDFIEQASILHNTDATLGHDFSADDYENTLKEKYGIDTIEIAKAVTGGKVTENV